MVCQVSYRILGSLALYTSTFLRPARGARRELLLPLQPRSRIIRDEMKFGWFILPNNLFP